jgi:hypothetical protein
MFDPADVAGKADPREWKKGSADLQSVAHGDRLGPEARTVGASFGAWFGAGKWFG